MVLLACDSCGEDVVTTMYFHDVAIVEDNVFGTISYKASVYGKAICPKCGAEINTHFHHEISKRDIISLAVNGEIQ